MPAINTTASGDQAQSNHNHANLDGTSQPKAEERVKPSQLALSRSSRSISAKDNSSNTTASSYSMQRWLAQEAREEPWCAGSRIPRDETHGTEAEQARTKY